MGAVIVVNFQTDDPNYELKIQEIIAKLEKETGEPVTVDIGVMKNNVTPDEIQINRTINI